MVSDTALEKEIREARLAVDRLLAELCEGREQTGVLQETNTNVRKQRTDGRTVGELMEEVRVHYARLLPILVDMVEWVTIGYELAVRQLKRIIDVARR